MTIPQIIEFAFGATGCCLNLFVMPIILTKSSQRIGKYKYFLLAYTINACGMTITQMAALPTWYIPPNGYFWICTVHFLPRWVQQIPVMGYIATFVFNSLILAWSFIYRMEIIEKCDEENNRPWLVTRRYFPIAFLFSVLLCVYMVFSTYSIMPSLETEAIFRDWILNNTGYDLRNSGYIGGEIMTNGRINTGMAICLVSFVIFVGSTCSTYVYCWYKIGAKLRELRRIASVNYTFQYKLYILLTLQTCMPIIFNYVPPMAVFILSLAKIPCGNVILFFAMVMSVAQIADPLFTIMLIAEYKMTILEVFNTIMHTSIGWQSTVSAVSATRTEQTRNEAPPNPPEANQISQM